MDFDLADRRTITNESCLGRFMKQPWVGETALKGKNISH